MSLEKKLASLGYSQSKKLFNYILFDYYNIAEFFKVKYKKYREKAPNIYYDTYYFWRDLMGPTFSCKRQEKDKKIRPIKYPILNEGDHIKLENIYVTDWFPRAPGREFTISGDEYMHRANIVSKKAKGLTLQTDKNRDWKKWLNFTALTGQSTIRFNLHNNMKLLTAYNLPINYGSIPIVTTNNVWKKIRDEIFKYGAIHLEHLEGYLISKTDLEIYPNLPIWEYSQGVPNLALYIPSRLLLKGIGEPEKAQSPIGNLFVKDNSEIFFDLAIEIGTPDYSETINIGVEALNNFARYINPSLKPSFEIDETIPRYENSEISMKTIFNFKNSN